MNRDVYIALIITGCLPVVGGLVRGGSVGSGVTLCILMIAAGIVGLLVEARPWVPRARAVKRR